MGSRPKRWRGNARRSFASEAGFSLLEICATVAIMGVALASLIGAMATSTSASDLMARRAQTESHARHLTELLRSRDVELNSCVAGDASLSDAYERVLAPAAVDNLTASVVDARFTNDPLRTDPLGAGWSSACWTQRPDLEWVQIEVTGENGARSRVSIVLRNASPT